MDSTHNLKVYKNKKEQLFIHFKHLKNVIADSQVFFCFSSFFNMSKRWLHFCRIVCLCGTMQTPLPSSDKTVAVYAHIWKALKLLKDEHKQTLNPSSLKLLQLAMTFKRSQSSISMISLSLVDRQFFPWYPGICLLIFVKPRRGENIDRLAISDYHQHETLLLTRAWQNATATKVW